MTHVNSEQITGGGGDNAGKIVTQNPALLALLRENTMDKQSVRKVYVSSPAFYTDDDDSYRYVSTDVEAFDDDHNRAVYAVNSTRRDPDIHPDSYNQYQPPNQASHNSTRLKHQSNSSVHSQRYDDHSSGANRGKENYPHDVQYVLKSRDGRQSGSQASIQTGHPSMVQPIQSPLKPLSIDEEEDRRTLQEEAAYQNQLLSRFHDLKAYDDQMSIPRLPLNFADDDYGDDNRGVEDSLEFHHNDALRHDSLDDSDDRNMSPQPVALMKGQQRESSAVGRGKSSHDSTAVSTAATTAAGVDPQSRELQQHQLIMSQQQQLQNVLAQQNQMMMMLMMQQQQQQQQQPSHQAQQINPMLVGGQALPPNSSQTVTQISEQSPHIPLNVSQNQQSASHTEQTYRLPSTQQHAHGDHFIDAEGDFADLDPGQDGYYGEYEDEEQARDHSNSDFIADRSGALSGTDTQESEVTYPESPRQKVDYLQFNKQVLKTGQPKKSYGQLLHKKKEFEVLTPKPFHKKVSSNKPPLPKNQPHSMPASASKPSPSEEVISSKKPTSAEHIWQTRSKSLADHKAQKSKQSGKSHKPGALRKYPSDSKVSELRANQSPKAHHITPLPHSSTSTGTSHPITAAPLAGEVNLNGSNSPIRHTIVTDDGQKVNVDINLKLNTPSPNQPGSPVQFLRIGAKEASPKIPIAPHQQGQPHSKAYTHSVQSGQQKPMRHAPQHYQLSASPNQQASFAGQQGQAHARTHNMQLTHGMANQQAMKFPDTEYYEPYNEPPSPTTSPYKVLPPIGSADTEQGRSPTRNVTDPNQEIDIPQMKQGYMDQYKKQQNRNIDYKVYTLKDYKNLKREIKLGGLGPEVDSETHKERREKVQRQMEYARTIQERNRQQVKTRPIVPDTPNDTDLLDSRRVALEYSKSVPKPKVASKHLSQSPSSLVSPSPGGDLPSHRASQRTNTTKGLTMDHQNQLDVIDLERLQQRHEEERRKVALIRQHADHTVSPHA